MKRYLLFALLALPLLADQQQPFDKNVVGVGVGYTNQNRHVVPEFDLDIRMGSPVLGFQPYSYTGITITGIRGNPLQVQTSGLEGVAMVHQLGEYVYYGFLGAPGVAIDVSSVGMAGRAGAFVGYRFGKSQHWSVAGVFAGDFSSLNKSGSVSPSLFFTGRFGWGK